MNGKIEQIKAWPLLGRLPREQAGFTLSLELTKEGTQFHIFSYANLQDYRKISVVYDEVTKDFLAKVTVGLNDFYDVSFICTELESLEKLLTTKLEQVLVILAGHQEYESIFRSQKILEWPYSSLLPEKAAGFRLFIRPQQPLKFINGSYIIIDYSDFAAASNLSISYNVYRDEFFGQIRFRHTPQMIADFDAKDLGELADKLKCGLQPALEALRLRIGQSEGDG